MKIQKISFQNLNNNSDIQKKHVINPIKKVGNKKKLLNIGAAAAGAAIIAASLYYCVKSPRKAVNACINAGNSVTGYKQTLAECLSKRLNKPINAEDLECVLDKKQFVNELQQLSEKNYVFTPENIGKGIFRADLHSHSTYSDGEISVAKLMEQVSNYSKKLYEKTGKKFLFALTDHDGVEGVKEALEIIAQNPKQFKYLNFVTGSELSYAHKSTATSNPCETSELLAYCFNPFSETTNKFFNGIKTKRQNLIVKYINDLQKYFPDINFNIDEFKQIYNQEDALLMNIHWKVYHYAQTKKAISELANNQNLNAEELYKQIMSKTGKQKYLDSLKAKNLLPEFVYEDELIKDINNQYRPFYNKKVITSSENTLEEIFNVFSQDKETIMGFAHPYYMTERLYDVKSFADELIKKSGSILKLTESWHQDYKNNILKTKINNINKIMEDFGLIPLGGRDNHKVSWDL